jgi:predicted component of type VI protein secretion system
MASVTFQVLEGVDRGRVFRNLATPVTIGREEGNLMRLNDERVSRFHAKVQEDNGDVILTDLESTNGTRVNGGVVQIRRLRPGDRVCVGRSLLLFGSNQEIAKRLASSAGGKTIPGLDGLSKLPPTEGTATIQANALAAQMEDDLRFDLNVRDEVSAAGGELFAGNIQLPPLPQRMTPSQAARFAEILDFLHRGITVATENITANEEGTQITLSFADWQKILAVQMLLGRYVRAMAEPDVLEQ